MLQNSAIKEADIELQENSSHSSNPSVNNVLNKGKKGLVFDPAKIIFYEEFTSKKGYIRVLSFFISITAGKYSIITNTFFGQYISEYAKKYYNNKNIIYKNLAKLAIKYPWIFDIGVSILSAIIMPSIDRAMLFLPIISALWPIALSVLSLSAIITLPKRVSKMYEEYDNKVFYFLNKIFDLAHKWLRKLSTKNSIPMLSFIIDQILQYAFDKPEEKGGVRKIQNILDKYIANGSVMAASNALIDRAEEMMSISSKDDVSTTITSAMKIYYEQQRKEDGVAYGVNKMRQGGYEVIKSLIKSMSDYVVAGMPESFRDKILKNIEEKKSLLKSEQDELQKIRNNPSTNPEISEVQQNSEKILTQSINLLEEDIEKLTNVINIAERKSIHDRKHFVSGMMKAAMDAILNHNDLEMAHSIMSNVAETIEKIQNSTEKQEKSGSEFKLQSQILIDEIQAFFAVDMASINIGDEKNVNLVQMRSVYLLMLFPRMYVALPENMKKIIKKNIDLVGKNNDVPPMPVLFSYLKSKGILDEKLFAQDKFLKKGWLKDMMGIIFNNNSNLSMVDNIKGLKEILESPDMTELLLEKFDEEIKEISEVREAEKHPSILNNNVENPLIIRMRNGKSDDFSSSDMLQDATGQEVKSQEVKSITGLDLDDLPDDEAIHSESDKEESKSYGNYSISKLVAFLRINNFASGNTNANIVQGYIDSPQTGINHLSRLTQILSKCIQSLPLLVADDEEFASNIWGEKDRPGLLKMFITSCNRSDTRIAKIKKYLSQIERGNGDLSKIDLKIIEFFDKNDYISDISNVEEVAEFKSKIEEIEKNINKAKQTVSEKIAEFGGMGIENMYKNTKNGYMIIAMMNEFLPKKGDREAVDLLRKLSKKEDISDIKRNYGLETINQLIINKKVDFEKIGAKDNEIFPILVYLILFDGIDGADYKESIGIILNSIKMNSKDNPLGYNHDISSEINVNIFNLIHAKISNKQELEKYLNPIKTYIDKGEKDRGNWSKSMERCYAHFAENKYNDKEKANKDFEIKNLFDEKKIGEARSNSRSVISNAQSMIDQSSDFKIDNNYRDFAKKFKSIIENEIQRNKRFYKIGHGILGTKTQTSEFIKIGVKNKGFKKFTQKLKNLFSRVKNSSGIMA